MSVDVVGLAEQQVQRLGGVGRVLSVRLATPVPEAPKLVRAWLRAVPAHMALWGRLCPMIDLGSIGMEAEDASPSELKRGKALNVKEYAEETATDVLSTKAAVPLDIPDRSTRNKVLFYLDREIGDITRIFRL